MLLSSELFLDSILLLINENSDASKKTVNDLIAIYEKESKTNTTLDNELTKFYIRLLKVIINDSLTKKNEDELRLALLKFKSDKALSTRRDIFDLLNDTFSSKEDMSVRNLQKLAERLQNTLLWYTVNGILRKAYTNLNKAADATNPTNQRALLQKIREQSVEIDKAYREADPEGGSDGAAEQINFSDKSSIQKALTKFKDRTVKGVLKMGLQGLNMMCGAHGGLVLGESVVFNALSHNYKSGILMSCAKWIAMYNTPPMDPEGRKPCILFFSLENEAHQNMMDMFKTTYETTYQRSSGDLTDEEIINYIYEIFNQCGYEIIIERYQPSNFGFTDLVRRIEYFESCGYRVVATVIDYMNNMKKGNDDRNSNAGNHLLVKELYSAVCNYMKNKAITLITAHQLNRDALKLKSQGYTDIVKRFGGDHLADSLDVQREVDLEIYMHKEYDHQGNPYLTFNRGKHRYVNNTPDAHKYFAYPFTKYGIVDDINGPPGFTRNIYQNADTADSTEALIF